MGSSLEHPYTLLNILRPCSKTQVPYNCNSSIPISYSQFPVVYLQSHYICKPFFHSTEIENTTDKKENDYDYGNRKHRPDNLAFPQ